MIRLSDIVFRNGYQYHLVRRSDKKAIYCQTKQNIVIGYEVFKIRIRRARYSDILKKDIPAQEIFPGDEDFGKTAWSLATLEDAIIKYSTI